MKNISTLKLLENYSKILKELKIRGVLRTSNNPVGDYAEYLVSQKLKLELSINSNKSFDAIGKNKKTYQIKARRGNSKLLGVMRSIDFDFLIVVIFNENFLVQEAYQIPKEIIKGYSSWSKYQKGHILNLNNNILKDKKIKNISHLLK